MAERPLDTPRDKYTVVHNLVFDAIMPTLSGNECKILLLIIRSTIGWHKDKDQLSYSQIKKKTGIKSKTTIASCLKTLKEKRYILEIQHSDQWEANTYALNTKFELDEAPVSKNGQAPVSKNGQAPVSKNGQAPVSKNGHTKESIKENKTKKKDPAAFAAPPPPLEKITNGKSKPQKALKEAPHSNGSAPRGKKELSQHQQLMAAYQDALGYPIPNGGMEGKAAKEILKHYTVQQAIDCYHVMKSEAFWRDKYLSLQSVKKQLGEFVAGCENRNAVRFETAEDTAAEFARMNSHLPPLGGD